MPNNYNSCLNCPYYNQMHLAPTPNLKSHVNSPLSIRYGRPNADELLIFQAPGIDEWQGNTVSRNREPIDSTNSHSAAARMRNSMGRKRTNRNDYDITEAVQCFPGKNANNRDKQPCVGSRKCCIQYLINDLQQKKYNRIVAFGNIAYRMATIAVKKVLQLGYAQPQPSFAKHPSAGVSRNTLDQSY